ncbi:hypothetical protein IMSHALPRED_002470 [Imshaugia aleurites]|uniref:rRNA methyltransferase 1, mitochondrial n=1 Tax=Imshaugia aleurites TaxID=172621 RepID=A0A8H3PHX2_9LECA|nr:hypothetical protein IMSHALPRED_002470 [Imshaugia aleurites]
MLKAVACISNGLGSKCLPGVRNHLRQQILPAYISTNTAINKSLRRSQYDSQRPERKRTSLSRTPAEDFVSSRSTRDGDRAIRKRTSGFDAPRERRPRPNYQQGIDAEDLRESANIKESQRTQRRLRKPLRRDEKGDFDRSTRGAKYDYTSKPEGNRALRRALKFGRQVDPAVIGQSNSAIRRAAHRKAFHGDKNHISEKDLFGRTPFDRTSRRAATLNHEEEQTHGLSMPQDLQDGMDTSTEPHRLRFSVGRHLDRPDRAPFANRTSSRDSEGYGRDLSQHDDQQSLHRNINVPLSMPYTTPASEFLYGTSVITAALLSSRRKLYKLYIYGGDNREVHEQDKRIRELALKRGVVVERVKGDWLRLMDKMSAGRPHNGYILEASPLPKLPVVGFGTVGKRNGAFHVILDYQSREDEAVNGTTTNIKYDVGFPRYPFALLLDGILDPGNLGAILRTAFFLGVDTVAISNRSSAPVSPVALKASAGASETLPLVSVSQPGSFIDECRSNGWKIYAAVAPSPGKRTGVGNYFSTSDLGSPVRNHPCLLILGGEGEGLRWNIQRKADYDVGIDGARNGQGKVDSLNVSVAAGLLCEAFLRKPAKRLEVDVDAPFDAETWTASQGHGAKVHVENRVF